MILFRTMIGHSSLCFVICYMFNLQMQDPADLPLALKDLVGKTYLFKVGIEKENYLYKSGTYKVIKICTNIDMIAEFENLSQPKVVKKNI